MDLAKELKDQLYRCIAMLPKAERELIQAIYFEGMNDSAYAREVKMLQSGINRKHKKILSKLKLLMKFLRICHRCGSSIGGIVKRVTFRREYPETEIHPLVCLV